MNVSVSLLLNPCDDCRNTGWNELLIAAFSHRSISVKDEILLATGLHVSRDSTHNLGVEAFFDRLHHASCLTPIYNYVITLSFLMLNTF